MDFIVTFPYMHYASIVCYMRQAVTVYLPYTRWCNSGIGQMMLPLPTAQDVQVLIPGTCEDVTLYGKRYF
jgi:hypothetical protein